LPDTGERMGIQWDSASAIHIDFKKACDSVKRDVLYNILLEFGTTKKLVWLIKIY
jgi:hypothetical protein